MTTSADEKSENTTDPAKECELNLREREIAAREREVQAKVDDSIALDLVLEAIKTGDPNKACTNLVFFVKLGLVDDSNDAIRTACAGTKNEAPSLPGGPVTT